ncbi:sensor domain-containing diguanylate cyclase [Sulfuriferula thiophila]|uniref:sensor domain-containing diguanylate cyclase n=1 Tax=Sulfuriferula thiophila TaxID=1781211 RepID=UPI000F60AD56|nr:sensor domain-containing diguanylate cyclase [Sulfuriferula thiophila]
MKRRVSVKIAVAVSVLALLGSAAVSVLYYYSTYSKEVMSAQHDLAQLGQTVQRTASIAAYLADRELANEVVQGLLKNQLVAAVELTGGGGFSASSGLKGEEINKQPVHIKLESPFVPGEIVGDLKISLRQQLVETRANSAAWTNAAMLAGYTLFVSLLVFLLIQWQFISSIKRIAVSLKKIVPGQNERLHIPAKHQYDEIGGLVENINQLLGLVQSKLDNERALLSQMEMLEKQFRMIYERAGVGIFLMDQRARLVIANPAFQEIIGKPLYEHILGKDINCMMALFSELDKTLCMLDETFARGNLSAMDLQIAQVNSTEDRWVHCLLTQLRDESTTAPDNQILVQGIITDISDRRREEQFIRLQAERDPLTNLFNRRSAEHGLFLLLEKAGYEGSCIAVCMLDLDNFKPVNDTYGHDAGDRVLIEIAQRMSMVLRSSDIVARLGGDEFLLVIQGIGQHKDIELLLDKLLNNLAEDIDIGEGVSVRVGASIGVALSPENGTAMGQLITLADRAMYQVKQRGKKGYQFYD